MKNKIISCQNVGKTFGTASMKRSVLDGINLEVFAGEHLAIVGPSGSGKSTLLNMIAGIDTPSSGQVLINGKCWKTMNEKNRSVWRGLHIGIVFQFFQLIPTLSIEDNILLAFEFVGKIPVKERKDRANYLMGRTGILSHAKKLPNQLSGGEQQRAAIARALANDPMLIVADEPTGNLDSKNKESIFALFDSLATEGKSIIVVTHERQIGQKFDRIMHIEDGQFTKIDNKGKI